MGEYVSVLVELLHLRSVILGIELQVKHVLLLDLSVWVVVTNSVCDFFFRVAICVVDELLINGSVS